MDISDMRPLDTFDLHRVEIIRQRMAKCMVPGQPVDISDVLKYALVIASAHVEELNKMEADGRNDK